MAAVPIYVTTVVANDDEDLLIETPLTRQAFAS